MAEAGESRPLHVGVVGATGNVGTAMLAVLEERGVPIASLRTFASARSAGVELSCGDQTARTEVLDAADPTGLDVALFSAGAERARRHAHRFAGAGCTVIDNSSAFRMEADVPLVIPEVNPDALGAIPRGIVANPNCSTIQLLVALKPIHDAVGIRRMVVTTMQSTSGTGAAAMGELREQARADIDGAPAPAPTVYPHPIAFNIIPQCDTFLEDGSTGEETKVIRETRKILDAPDLPIGVTCTRVPVYVSHSEAVHLELEHPLPPDDARRLLAAAPGVQVVDDTSACSYPTPLDASGHDDVFVGRIRSDASVPDGRGLAMFIVGDNLRKGAATNAVQILEELARRGHW